MRKIWDFHGGVHPPENKAQSNQLPIATVAMADEYVVPLNQHIGTPSLVTVAVGEHVLKGQTIAEAQGYVSVAAHAPTSGTVSAIELRPVNHPSGLEAMCVVIKPDHKDQWIELKPLERWRELDKTELTKHLAASGIAGMGGAGFPTSVKMCPRADQHIDTLILNGTECEPYITADDVLMRELADEIVSGLDIMAHMLGSPRHVIVGVEDNKPEAAEAMRVAAARISVDIEVVTFPTKYPSGGEKQLIQILTGKEVPSGRIPADIGIVLQNVGTARAAYRSVIFGEPLISRVTTLVGNALERQQNVHALIGTPIHHLLNHHGFDEKQCDRIIIGGPMMGYAMPHTLAPIIKTTNCVLVPSKEEIPAPEPEQPCIRCGMCAEACPASLLPQQLYWFSRSEDFDRLRSHNLSDCIECGACSYVCPSNIPLVQYYRASKGAIRHHDEEKRKAEHSRKRFEFRKERLEKAEAEKRAKREARKKAAEAAKAKLSDTPAAKAPKLAATTNDSSNNAPVVDAQKTKSKLERAYASATSRVERATKALSDAKEEVLDASRIESLAARLKDAEVKASDAKKRLADFNENFNTDGTPSSTQPDSEASKKTGMADVIESKLAADASTKLQKTVETLRKRLNTAQEKMREAERNASPTFDALKTGVEKLHQKLQSAEAELADAQTHSKNSLSEKAGGSDAVPGDVRADVLKTSTSNPAEASAAQKAIERAQARSVAHASMSEDEKKRAQIESLKKRLQKAEARLTTAKETNDENLAAFEAGVEKLKSKLNSLSE